MQSPSARVRRSVFRSICRPAALAALLAAALLFAAPCIASQKGPAETDVPVARGGEHPSEEAVLVHTPSVDPNTAQRVYEVLAQLARAYMSKNVDDLMELCAPDPVLFVGTGQQEWVESRAALEAAYRAEFSHPGSLRIAFVPRFMGRKGEVVWAGGAAPVTVDSPEGRLVFPARFTAVLCKTRGHWRIAQMHISVPTDAKPMKVAPEAAPGAGPETGKHEKAPDAAPEKAPAQ
ncbi:hypothetical protein dsx2_2374 [Desulfovibrio sp. X2]|uniref:nuclear transport factor 2 family protein n=1 Tax=Desulfovibrio sp. X2 TaxID=941449 RepID=UPI000358BDD1|nr:nuclear transport factor 2 family protein [Desulfovibrio sp. X2]EPR43523.1 hypothetical protein dsx2_2374 [Desulfovibrio sp. X2]